MLEENVVVIRAAFRDADDRLDIAAGGDRTRDLKVYRSK
jgi:hypothetical protein